MITKMPESLRYVRADEIAECYDGLAEDTYRFLWDVTRDLERKNGGELSGPEPDAPENRLEAIWKIIPENHRVEIIRATKHEEL
jgi:hypothetical protein